MGKKKDIADIKSILQLHENIKRLEILSSRIGSDEVKREICEFKKNNYVNQNEKGKKHLEKILEDYSSSFDNLRAYLITLNHVVKALEILTLSNSEEE